MEKVNSLIQNPESVVEKAVGNSEEIFSQVINKLHEKLKELADGTIPETVYEYYLTKDVLSTDTEIGECSDQEKLYLMVAAKFRSKIGPLTKFLNLKKNQEDAPIEYARRNKKREIAKMASRMAEGLARQSIMLRFRNEIRGRKIQYRKDWIIVI